MDIAVRNSAQAVKAVLSYMRERKIENAPAVETKWQETTLYSPGPEDMAVTGKLFTADDWIIEVSQNVAPLSRTVYRVTVFNTGLHSYWKGGVRADNGLVEVNNFGSLSEEESRQAEEEFVAKSKIPPPKPGGYGH
jgi:hypothetical protein